MIIRSALVSDVNAITAIYGHHCLRSLGTFEEVAPSPEEMRLRLDAVTTHSLPYLVAEQDSRVIGFAYAGPFKPRAAYRFTVEDSIYLHPDNLGRGIGKALLSEIISRCEALGMRQMMAVIGDSGNAGSINLHRSLGFEHKGIGADLGFKQGRWVDIVWMQRALNGGSQAAPDAAGLKL